MIHIQNVVTNSPQIVTCNKIKISMYKLKHYNTVYNFYILTELSTTARKYQ